MGLIEKAIIEKGKFLIADQEAEARAPSFLARWHEENAIALTAMLDSYIRLNMLEQCSLRLTGKSLTDVLSTFGDVEVEMLSIDKKEFCGPLVSRVVHDLDGKGLLERGMVEKFTTAAERTGRPPACMRCLREWPGEAGVIVPLMKCGTTRKPIL